VLRLINFAHSEMFTAGAFVAVAAAGVLGGIAGHPGIALLAGLIAFVAIGLLGVSVELVAYRPLRNSSRLAPMLSALGMAVVIQNVVMLVGGRRPLIYPSFLPRGVIQVAGAIITYKQIAILVVALVLMVGLELLVSRTSLGVKIRAVAESAETASLVGINPNLPIALIFFVGPGLGAVAGILYASYYGVATFSMGFIIGMKAFTAAILGGIGSIPGAVLGGVLRSASSRPSRRPDADAHPWNHRYGIPRHFRLLGAGSHPAVPSLGLARRACQRGNHGLQA
jgi:branched-chain amino acid transport system permease protein